jgi:AcrR family transcriptional regulator
MGRRSDHSRAELRELILAEGHRQIGDAGYAAFSARAVAKAIGYTVGTIYNVFGTHDALILAINARTVEQWTADLRRRLEDVEGDRIAALVRGYFEFALSNRHAWAAIYDHRLADPADIPDWYVTVVGELTGTMRREVQRVLPDASREDVAALSRSLLASVHGHCVFALNGTFAQLGEAAPLDAALARVREAIAGAEGICLP